MSCLLCAPSLDVTVNLMDVLLPVPCSLHPQLLLAEPYFTHCTSESLLSSSCGERCIQNYPELLSFEARTYTQVFLYTL
jgi:hypothetical protein